MAGVRSSGELSRKGAPEAVTSDRAGLPRVSRPCSEAGWRQGRSLETLSAQHTRTLLPLEPARCSQREQEGPAGPDTPRSRKLTHWKDGDTEAPRRDPCGLAPRQPQGAGVRGRAGRTCSVSVRITGSVPPGSPTGAGLARRSRSPSWRPLPSTCSWRPPAALPCPAWPCSTPRPCLSRSCRGCQVGPGGGPLGLREDCGWGWGLRSRPEGGAGRGSPLGTSLGQGAGPRWGGGVTWGRGLGGRWLRVGGRGLCRCGVGPGGCGPGGLARGTLRVRGGD